MPSGGWGELARQRDGGGLRARGRRRAVQQPQRARPPHPQRAAGEHEVLGGGETDQRREPGRADGHAEPRARPGEPEVVRPDAQVAPGRDLGARTDDVADAHAHGRSREGLDGGVDARKGLHPSDAAGAVEHLGDVGTGAQRARARGRDDEDAQPLVGRQLGEGRLELGQRGGVQRVARLRAIEAHDLDPVVEPLAL